jgi:SAM-dependent methyltransferase
MQPSVQPSAKALSVSLLALYDYSGSRANELSFRTGDVVDIVSKDTNGWWLVQAQDGKQGLVPRNYFSLEDSEDGSEEAAAEDGSEESDQDEEYFSEYGSNIHVHAEMLQDTTRTEAYRDAILSHAAFIRGKTVLDVGCGTGVLSIFCARAGARKVYAVDASNMTAMTKKIVEQNGLAEQIEVLHGKIQEIELPSKVDVIVSEWMGTMLLFEGMLDSVLFARDRWLVEGGLLLPERAEIFVAPVHTPDFYRQKVGFWHSVYGIDMSPLCKPAAEYWIQRPIITYDIRPRQLMAAPVLLKLLDMRTITRADLDFLEIEWAWPQGGVGKADAAAEVAPSCAGMYPAVFRMLGFASSSGTWEGIERGEINEKEDKEQQQEERVIHGFVGWFDCHFGEPRGAPKPESHQPKDRNQQLIERQKVALEVALEVVLEQKEVTLSTAPVAEDTHVAPTHWKQSLFVLDEPMVVQKGSAPIDCIAMMKRNESHPRHYHVAFSLQVRGAEEQVQKCWRLWR